MKRNANILCEISGYGMSSDAFHYTLPEPTGDGAFRAMNNAIIDANLTPESFEYINAHGTSTPSGDEVEIRAIDRIFSQKKDKINVSSTKSQIGHLLGAAGAVEAVYSIDCLNNNEVPYNLNLENEIESNSINLIKDNPLELELNNVLSNSFGFGGTNVSIVLSKFNDS